MMAQYTAPDSVLKLVGTITESGRAYGEHMAKIGIDTIFCDNSSAGGELNPPDACEQFDHTFLRRLINDLKGKGIGMVLHNDSIQPYLQQQLALQPKGLQFHLKYVDMKNTFDLLRGKTCVFAGIDHQELLFKKTPADVNMEVRRMMMGWGKGPGFVMASGCELAYKTPVENLKALKDATIQFGSEN